MVEDKDRLTVGHKCGKETEQHPGWSILLTAKILHTPSQPAVKRLNNMVPTSWFSAEALKWRRKKQGSLQGTKKVKRLSNMVPTFWFSTEALM